MAKVPCPGTEIWRQGYFVNGNGLDPLSAIINAFLKLLLQMATTQGLLDFLEKECANNCWRRLTGPEFPRFVGALNLNANGTWDYVLMTTIEFRIDCRTKVPEYISNEQLMEDLLASLPKEDYSPEQKGLQGGAPRDKV